MHTDNCVRYSQSVAPSADKNPATMGTALIHNSDYQTRQHCLMNENAVEVAHAKQKNKVSNLWVGTQSPKEPLSYFL